ncbi:MAG: M48 family metallopeptidase [Brevundimonas sp.]|nr:MAG: M48 family metallopeptidase [Brevundimonas sp.]
MNRLMMGLAALAATATLGGCAYNEALGRNQVLLTNNAALQQQSDAAWAEALRTQRVSNDAAGNARIRRVGDRIVQAAGLSGTRWDYALFTSDSPNAFVLPSGKISVTTGLLALVQNDDQLATVIGHEMAHSVAQHAAERYSQNAIASIGLQVASGLAGDYGRAVGSFGGLAAHGVLLPYSRRDELEADRLGVDLMQRAGFRPLESAALWRLMAAQRQTNVPQFASTHPSDLTRIAALEAYIRERGWS